ncbi:HNH endonuclease signature motif containing protein [Leucobacter sp. M11]|uniref:HNH endonuclease signature motif containing protein n=1 Tax=Leucobacter sp. M11 TaxID=2993565 RepID=UPI002D808A16|nr:DUF222 domain-containing protein [Leucobacter sp. M11]MEB4615743.1 DUF222 domain-containing protein [Leucobacter sp. M11]
MVSFTPVAPRDTAPSGHAGAPSVAPAGSGAFARVPGTSAITGTTAARIAERIATDARNAAARVVAPAEHPLAQARVVAEAEYELLTSEELRVLEAALSEEVTELTREKNRAEARRAERIAALAHLTDRRFARESLEAATRALLASDTDLDQRESPREVEQRMLQLAEETACAVTAPKQTGAKLLSDAITLTEDLPHTWAAHAAGLLDQGRVSTIVSVTQDAPPVARAILDERLAEIGPLLTPGKLFRVAEALRNRVDPVSPEARHADAFQRRGAWLEPARNGMMQLTVRSAAPELSAAFDRIDALAKQLAVLEQREHEQQISELRRAHAAGEPGTGTREELDAAINALPLPRTIAQLRADVSVDLVSLGEIDPVADPAKGASEPAAPAARRATTPARGVRGQILVTIPARLLSGLSWDGCPENAAASDPAALLGREFAALDGYGILDDETARRVGLGLGQFRALFTDDAGAILNVGRNAYAPPQGLRRFTELRDQHCRFPGCERPAVRCDLDHSVPWDAGGDTAHGNLAFLCRTHHTLKGRGDPGGRGPDGQAGIAHRGWRLIANRNGVLEWETLSGRRIITLPERAAAPPPGG